MKLVLKFAFALSTAALLVGAPIEPLAAQGKTARPKLKLSPDFAKAFRGPSSSYAAAQKAKASAAKAKKVKDRAKFQNVERTALNKAKAGWPAMKAAVRNDDDRYQAASFAFDIMGAFDNAMRKDAIEFALASKSTPASDRPRFAFQSGVLALEAKDYANAQKIMLESYSAGYRGGDAELHISDSFNALGNPGEALAWLKRHLESVATDKGRLDPKLYARGMNYAIRTNNAQDVDFWAKALVRNDPRPEAWHDALLQVSRHSNLSAADALDLMRLMRKAGGLMFEEDYLLYLQLLDKDRYPAEALAVLDEGTAKGKVSRNNLAVTEARGEANAALLLVRNSRPANEAAAKAGSSGYPALVAGDVAFSFGDYTQAKELYEAALPKGVVDPAGTDQSGHLLNRLALTRLYLNDARAAKADLEKVTPGSSRTVADYLAIYADQIGTLAATVVSGN